MAAPQIEDYEFGHIVIDGQTYTDDVIIRPDGVQVGWEKRSEKHQLTRKDIETLLLEEPEVLILGLGAGARLGLTRKAIACLEASGVDWRALSTRKACKAYNRERKGKRVVAALHLTS